MLTAQKAYEASIQSSGLGLNYQREFIFSFIKKAIKIGRFNCQIHPNPYVVIFEEDWQFFEKLGYKIDRDYSAIYWNK